MKIAVEDTLEQYEKLYGLEPCKREDFFCYTMMKPFEAMWRFINVPLRAKEPGGYDVIMAAKMLGHLDLNETETGTRILQKLKEIGALSTAKETLQACTDFTLQHGLKINADELKLGLYIADPTSWSWSTDTPDLAESLDLSRLPFTLTTIIFQEFLP